MGDICFFMEDIKKQCIAHNYCGNKAISYVGYIDDDILKEILKTLPEEWSEEQKNAFNGKLKRLKIKCQQLRQKIEGNLLARMDREQKG
jgi:hypothetical protein